MNDELTRTNSKESPVIFKLLLPTLTVYLYSPSDASFALTLCVKKLLCCELLRESLLLIEPCTI